MATPGQPARGLTAQELAAACDELAALAGAEIADAVWVPGPQREHDLLLVLAAGSGHKEFLHVVAGGTRARLCTTARRWSKGSMRAAPLPLRGARLTRVTTLPVERIAVLHVRTGRGDCRLVVEMFGPGLFVFVDAEGRVRYTSRPVATAVRQLADDDLYVPPPPSPSDRMSATPPRFAPPVLPAIDDWFTRRDVLLELQHAHGDELQKTQRAARRAAAKVAGISGQLADVGRADGLRRRADLMLAYQHTVRRGAASMQVPDPDRDGEELTIELDASRPVIVQARALYEKARRLDDGRAIQEERLRGAQAELAGAERALAACRTRDAAVAALTADTPDLLARAAELRTQLPGPKPPDAGRTAKPQRRDEARGENVRRFVSAEGYPIWVGRNNEQNDRLTMHLANGNDLWLHVGGGRPGSHVVVRLPKQKTASLETLLDAATLAVHFSKARGEPRIEVVYTQRKHVRKPKGLPAGAVVPSQTKTVTVHADEARLRRLLDSGGADQTDADG